MSIESFIPSGPLKSKLRVLQDYLPHQKNEFYSFGALLADRFDLYVGPEGFVWHSERALYDMKMGLAHRSVFDDIHESIPKIARAVCPPEFAKDVARIYKMKY